MIGVGKASNMPWAFRDRAIAMRGIGGHGEVQAQK
jgi:hypothetical protein